MRQEKFDSSLVSVNIDESAFLRTGRTDESAFIVCCWLWTVFEESASTFCHIVDIFHCECTVWLNFSAVRIAVRDFRSCLWLLLLLLRAGREASVLLCCLDCGCCLLWTFLCTFVCAPPLQGRFYRYVILFLFFFSDGCFVFFSGFRMLFGDIELHFVLLFCF